MNLREMGLLVRERRISLGLSQQRLAKLAGLSRATVVQLEAGSLVELGVTKLAGLMDLLGLQLNAGKRAAPRQGLLMASLNASVSYKAKLGAGQLAKALTTGDIPDGLMPHLVSLLDETPLPLVVAAVEEAAAHGRMPAKRIWQHLARWAREFASPRPVWA